MGFYRLRAPAEAIQYARNTNETEIAELVKGNGGGSYSNASGSLELWNIKTGAERVTVQPGQWVVKIGNGSTVLSDAEFQTLFVTDRVAE